jgi:hypothetical protein
MKKSAIIIIILAILGAALYYGYLKWRSEVGESANFATWQKFIPRSGLFEIFLPSPPQYGKDFVAIPNSDKKRRYDIYASEKVDGTLFLISVVTYPPEVDISSYGDILRQNINELMHNKTDNRLNNLWQHMFQDLQSLDFSFENQEFHVEGRAIHDDHIVYMLTYITQKENFDNEEYQHFIDSFKILKPNKNLSHY